MVNKSCITFVYRWPILDISSMHLKFLTIHNRERELHFSLVYADQHFARSMSSGQQELSEQQTSVKPAWGLCRRLLLASTANEGFLLLLKYEQAELLLVRQDGSRALLAAIIPQPLGAPWLLHYAEYSWAKAFREAAAGPRSLACSIVWMRRPGHKFPLARGSVIASARGGSRNRHWG